ncbi:C3H4 type zinc finger protein [Actinidia rufa]|uniref:C3H4 type zinc finger protein n=1 Tax=Actinidia rufa TaxID=165716 RepID=A0A7J0GB59_9ERIC|nr:C3H4 type zinc finger protein [Actinidia rufa]
MEVALSEICSEIDPDSHPLLMERVEIHNDREHIIDIARSSDTNSSSSHDHRPSGVDPLQPEDRPYLSARAPTHLTALSSSDRVNSRNSSFLRRGDGYAHRGRSPLNSGLWISVELVITVAQIIASIVVLSLSTHENPQTPLFAWVVGYASGCVATLPILYWRYCYRNPGTEQDSFQSHQGSSQSNPSPERASYAAFSIAQASEEDSRRTGSSASRNSGLKCAAIVFMRYGQTNATIIFPSVTSCLNSLVDHFKMALDCFFAVWFVVGNVWIFGGHSSPSDAPKLYSHDREINSVVDGEVMAAGAEKERAIAGEDAVCCICLAKYAENDELRELPCCHFFHVECIDKWLKINASCPLCKYKVGESNGSSSPSVTNSSPRHSGRRNDHSSAEGIYGTTMF